MVIIEKVCDKYDTSPWEFTYYDNRYLAESATTLWPTVVRSYEFIWDGYEKVKLVKLLFQIRE